MSATLVVSLRVPGAGDDIDPHMFANELVAILNEEREGNEGPDGEPISVLSARWVGPLRTPDPIDEWTDIDKAKGDAYDRAMAEEEYRRHGI